MVQKKYTLQQKIFRGITLSHLRSRSWRTKFSVALVILAVIFGVLTYVGLNNHLPFGHNSNVVIWLLNIDLVILLILVSFIARRLVSIWSGRKRKLAGSHLHVRLVYTFSLLAAVPTIIMTVFSAFFFHYGVQAWFSQRVQTAINESQAVAQAYLEEHKQVIRADTLAMAGDLDRYAEMLVMNENALNEFIETQIFTRNLSEAIIADENKRILAKSALSFSLEYELSSQYDLKQAQFGDVVVVMNNSDDRMRAITRLNRFDNAYLVVGRMVDPNVLSHLSSTKSAVEDYSDLQSKFAGIQVTATMIFVLVGLLLLCAAIWFGLILAKQLVKPIGELIAVSDRVRAGDYNARMIEEGNLEEFDYLAKSFNRMTSQINEQQGALIDANRQLDRRRRLTETVLSGVSSGVIGVDGYGIINLANNSAQKLLGSDADKMIGQPITKIIPELEPSIAQVKDRAGKLTQVELQISVNEREKRSFLFRMTLDLIGESDTGFIITFDDITELQSAQRKAAWSDVARRIAHEIKNPLTPIQLSAERLKRRYLKQITEDSETFVQCTDTIIRHVEDIGRMVNEFSSFARMPDAVLKEDNLLSYVKDTIILPLQAHRNISFTVQAHLSNYLSVFDAQQVRQAMTNLVQNAIESIEMRQQAINEKVKGSVDIIVDYHGNDEIFVAVTDNGIGFPENEDVSKLSDPYITHKPKGTGLGLAIVKKIMEDNGGQLIMTTPEWVKTHKDWSDKGGACVTLLFKAAGQYTQASNYKVKKDA